MALSLDKFPAEFLDQCSWDIMINVGETMPCLPRMTGNGDHTTLYNLFMVMTGEWLMTVFYPPETHHGIPQHQQTQLSYQL